MKSARLSKWTKQTLPTTGNASGVCVGLGSLGWHRPDKFLLPAALCPNCAIPGCTCLASVNFSPLRSGMQPGILLAFPRLLPLPSNPTSLSLTDCEPFGAIGSAWSCRVTRNVMSHCKTPGSSCPCPCPCPPPPPTPPPPPPPPPPAPAGGGGGKRGEFRGGPIL